MRFVLISDESIIFDGKASNLSCVSQNGEFVIMDNHIPYISKIIESVTYTTENNETNKIDIAEGFVYTNGDTCFAVVDTQ